MSGQNVGNLCFGLSYFRGCFCCVHVHMLCFTITMENRGEEISGLKNFMFVGDSDHRD